MLKEFKILTNNFSFKGLKAEIQTFEGILHRLTHIKSYRMERSGIIGKEEIRETVFFVMFGQEQLRQPEEFIVKNDKFFSNLNGKTLTIADLPGIKKEIGEIFDAHVPLEDRTKTPEQHGAELIERNKIHAENEVKQAEINKQKAIEKERVKKEYGYLLQSDGNISSRLLATKNIRRELDNEFPGHKFSITSETFAGGDAIDVRWEDGVTEPEVREIIGKYQEGHFDGMTDMYNYSYNPFNDLFGGAKYVHANRKLTNERFIEVGKEMGYDVVFNDYKMIVDGEIAQHDGSKVDKVRTETYSRSFYEKPAANKKIEVTAGEINTSNGSIEIRENVEKDGIEIKFASKPEAEVIAKLKMNGFRWSHVHKVWYKKASANARIFAESLIKQNNSNKNGNTEEGLITQENQTFETNLQGESRQEQI
jgi:hypothetical protein